MMRPDRGELGGRAAWFDESVAEQLADAMHGLSTPSRVQILGCLVGGPCSVGELVEALGMEQSAVSHQLRVLREHQLVRAERDGRRRVYAIYDEHVTTLLRAGLDHVEERRRPPARSSRHLGAAEGA
jgi:DNA-binding transcriptional ArsR family regulator